jgi:cytoskeletal protein CcmA (bactofilin family)
MFSRSNKPVNAHEPVKSGSEAGAKVTSSVGPSIISADLRIVGDMVSIGEIHIDGTVNGDIKCQILVIGQNGNVTGEILADNVRLHGTVTGQVQGKSVFLAATARMIGDVAHESLAIEPGAFIDGHCGRITNKKPETKVNLVADNTAAVKETTKEAPAPAANQPEPKKASG